jgi:hypothetical protein
VERTETAFIFCLNLAGRRYRGGVADPPVSGPIADALPAITGYGQRIDSRERSRPNVSSLFRQNAGLCIRLIADFLAN